MSTLNSNSSFQSWILTEKELLHGSVLTLLQKQCIQNQIAQCAEERLSLRLDPSNIYQFTQREAELQGQILALRYLMTLSDEAENKLRNPETSGEL